MNITPINNAQNFKGLWGQSKKSLSGADDNFLYEKTKFYHPFKDETKEEIKNVKLRNRYNNYELWPNYGYSFVNTVINVKEEEPLIFTKQEFQNYKKSKIGAKVPEEVSTPIEKELVKLGLYKYLNNAKEYMQELARRDTFTYKAKQLFRKIKAMLK